MDEVKILTRVHFQFDPVVSTVCVSSYFVTVCVCCARVCESVLHMCVLVVHVCIFELEVFREDIPRAISAN